MENDIEIKNEHLSDDESDEACGYEYTNYSEAVLEKPKTAVTRQDLMEMENRLKSHIDITVKKHFENFRNEMLRLMNKNPVKPAMQSYRKNNILPAEAFTQLDEFKNFDEEITKDNKFEELVAQFGEDAATISEKFIKNCWRKVLGDEIAQHIMEGHQGEDGSQKPLRHKCPKKCASKKI